MKDSFARIFNGILLDLFDRRAKQVDLEFMAQVRQVDEDIRYLP